MKPILFAALPLLLTSSPVQNETYTLKYAPDEGVILKRDFEVEGSLDLTDFSMTVDGEEPELGETELSYVWSESIVVEDELISVDEGRPFELVRTFSSLGQETVISGGEDEEDVELTSKSDLEGRRLRFEWDEDAEYYSVEADDEEGDLEELVLEWLEEDMDLRAVLPEDEVEIGDSWDIDEAVYLPLMWPGGLLGFYDEESDEEQADYQREINQGKIENLSGEGEATLEEVREEGDVLVAVLRIELTIETAGEGTEVGGLTDIEHTAKISRQLEGNLLWDITNHHLHSLEIEAEVETRNLRAQVIEFEEEEHELEDEQVFTGILNYTATIERESE